MSEEIGTKLEYEKRWNSKGFLGISQKLWFASALIWGVAGVLGYWFTKSNMHEHDVYCYVVLAAFFITSFLFAVLSR